MKKLLIVLGIMLVLCCAAFAGCGKEDGKVTGTSSPNSMQSTTMGGGENAVSGAGNAVGDAATGVGDAAADVVTGAGDIVGDVITGAGDIVSDAVDGR